jgi:predicted tellurium resistance membrane protein TerC
MSSAPRLVVVSSSSRRKTTFYTSKESIIKSGRAELTLSFPKQFCTFCSLKIVPIHLPPTQSPTHAIYMSSKHYSLRMGLSVVLIAVAVMAPLVNGFSISVPPQTCHRFHSSRHAPFATPARLLSSTFPSLSLLQMSAKGEEASIGPGSNNTDIPPIIGSGPTVILDDIPVDDIYKQAIRRTLAWVAGASLFGGILWATAGATTGEEFFAGYLVEQSLSVDNLFVFLLLFDYFQVPLQNQDRVLNFGIYGAIVMRAIMIALGAAALENFHAILLVFAGILVYSSAQVLIGGGEDEDEEEDMSENLIVKFSHRFIESTDKYDGNRFFTIVDGIRKATPLFICMIAVEISDVVFAVDSIPAVFGVTEVSRSVVVL